MRQLFAVASLALALWLFAPATVEASGAKAAQPASPVALVVGAPDSATFAAAAKPKDEVKEVPKDKPKRSKKNDDKDDDPDDGNAGGGNDDKELPRDGPIND